ncbi:unnamed protein product [Angiostrongylus costaricensis]|uniref:G protein-coupled receptor n=1 Tax=Angiostrongylus costaricensis TaxID=334426 RepID=A0A0R3PXC4_ANGCS|nr:unnamed protein product [Angiostrongylus costaricensis]
MFGRVALAIIILLLGLRMEKDFMRSITTAIFIPMMFCEIFNTYCEVIAYINLFTPTKEQYIWIKSLLYVIYNYEHYNVLVMVIMMLYCCRLAYQGEERIDNIFSTICLVAQFIPFFLSVLYYVTDGTTEIALLILSIASRVFLIICFIVINLQILSLPYTHANSADMQLRDARSRLFWTLVYVISPYIAFIPFIAYTRLINRFRLIFRRLRIHQSQLSVSTVRSCLSSRKVVLLLFSCSSSVRLREEQLGTISWDHLL